jgi:hypothetical protein
MGSNTARIAIVSALGLALLLWAGTSPAGDRGHGGPVFHTAPGQEVVNGSYDCYGSVYTDDQPPMLGAYIDLTATSGITSGFNGPLQGSFDGPADLDAMAAICEAHVDSVVADAAAICAVGPIRSDRGTFGNGESVDVRFSFSCQGTRDEVIGVIGSFSRHALAIDQP